MLFSTPTTTANSDAGNSNKENSALIPSSTPPILFSSILPKSTIKQFECDVLRRQAEYTTRITDLEGRLAMFHTRLAIECAERGREHAFTVSAYVDAPLEKAVRRSLELIDTEYVSPIMDPGRVTKLLAPNTHGEEPTDSNNATQNDEISPHQESKLTNLVYIERRANLLEAQISHHRHVTLFHTRREQFDTIEKEGRKILQPALAIEMTKADKREGGLVRRFDSNAGEYTRLVTEMISSRASSLGYVESILANWDISDSNRVKVYLEEISLLKHRVNDMREERIRQDELVVEKILQTKKVLEEDIFLAC